MELCCRFIHDYASFLALDVGENTVCFSHIFCNDFTSLLRVIHSTPSPLFCPIFSLLPLIFFRIYPESLITRIVLFLPRMIKVFEHVSTFFELDLSCVNVSVSKISQYDF